MAKRVNLKGQAFGRLIVVNYLDPDERDYRLNTWLCKCECGEYTQVSTSHLKNGNVKSCGCLNIEKQICDGLSKSRTYSSWSAMLERCYGVADENYINKGRTVCDRWLESDGKGFLNFYQDMGERPEGTSLERVDNSLGYFPENCVWTTSGEQAFNRDKFSNNTSGRTGVYERTNKGGTSYRVKINVNGETIELGTYYDYDKACEIRAQAELKYYGFSKE